MKGIDKMSGKPTDNRSPEEIRAEITERQNRLASTVDELTTRANPKTLVNQTKDEAIARFKDAAIDETGGPRVERLAAAAAIVVGAVVVFVLLKRRNS